MDDEKENKNISNINADKIDGITRPQNKDTQPEYSEDKSRKKTHLGNIARKANKLRKLKKRFEAKNPQEKKMTGAGFYMIVGVAIIKDLVDLIDLTGIGVILTTALGFLIDFIVWFYFFYTGVKYYQGRKLATFLISAIIEIIPGLNILPTFSFSLFIIRAMENNPKLKKVTKITKGKI